MAEVPRFLPNSMNKFKVPEDIQADLAAAVGPLEADIVETQ
jgi:hypothetical protein